MLRLLFTCTIVRDREAEAARLDHTSIEGAQPLLAAPTPAGMSRLHRLVWVVRIVALLAAVVIALHATQVMDDQTTRHFYQALVWYGIALAVGLIFAWDVRVRPVPQWRGWLASFLSTHWIEILLFLLILAFGLFMRLYKYGTLPPTNSLTFEEGINGGIAFKAIHGEAEFTFVISRYASSLGFLLFGYNAFGLRIFYVVGGILSIPILYLLLRDLVSVPIALFGTLLFAAAYWPSLDDRNAFEIGTVLTLLMAFFLIKGIKTRSSLAFFGFGIMCSLISYEYENFKPAPLYGLGFLALVGLWQLLPAARRGLRPARDALIALVRKAWRPALAFALAAGVVAGPMIVGNHLGRDTYLSSLHRNEADRTNRGTPGLIAPNWQQQAKWGAALFLPAGPDKANDVLPFTIRGIRVLDPLSATLVVVGTVYALFRLYRPYRILFFGWFVATLAAGALLLSNWAPWKFLGLVPIGFVLATFLLQDLRSFWSRHVPHPRARAFFNVALLGAAAYVCAWNGTTLFGKIVDSPGVQAEYGHTSAEWYAACAYMQDKGSDNFNYASLILNANMGFGVPHQTLQQQIGSWGDYIWVCHDLQGAPLVGPQESWPIRDVHSDPTSLVFMVDAEALNSLEASVQEGYPGAVQDELVEGPSKNYYIVGYTFTADLANSRQGLYGQYMTNGATHIIGEVDDLSNLSWASPPAGVTPPFAARWTGLVYLPDGGNYLLEARSPDGVKIKLDDGAAYDANDVPAAGAECADTRRRLAPGRHVDDQRDARRRPAASVALFRRLYHPA